MTAPWLGRAPRAWQAEAVDAVIRDLRGGARRVLVQACTGAGKSAVIAELCAQAKGRVLVTTPTQALVEQLSATLDARCPGEVGRAYQHAWETDRRLVVTCTASLGRVLAEGHTWAVWLADEAHRIESETGRDLYPRIPHRVGIGMTATPYRADARGLIAWERTSTTYTSSDAVRDGVLVPWRIMRAAEARPVDDLCEAWIRAASGPGIVSASSIEDAEEYADRLGGIAAVIHSRLPRAERAARIAALERGDLSCLVHVALLVEGVDLPWLRWLCLRRQTGSRVRLVQEVGRVLRSAPGKTEAVLYDPHDLLGGLGLVHAAALEDAGDVTPADVIADEEPESETPAQRRARSAARAVAISALDGWICDALGALRGAGWADPPTHADGPWRQQRASEKQIGALRKWGRASRYLPREVRPAIAWLTQQDQMRKGTASDLLSVLVTLGRSRGCPIALPEVPAELVRAA